MTFPLHSVLCLFLEDVVYHPLDLTCSHEVVGLRTVL